MASQLLTEPGPSPGSTLYRLVASVEPNYVGFNNYMRNKGVPVVDEEFGSVADYSSIGVALKVKYIPKITLPTPWQQGEAIVVLGTLLTIQSSQSQDLVEKVAEELLTLIKEVEDPESVQIAVNILRGG